jgi:integrase
MSDEFRPVAATLFYAALPISEALALTWADVDFDTAMIAVPGTKTDASKASVPLLPALGRELSAHRGRQAK